MTQIKKNSKFRHLQSDVEVIERYDNLLLAKIQPDFGQPFYDISSIKFDNDGGEHFDPSYFANGLKAETVNGGVRSPRTREEMQTKFDDLVTAAKQREIAASEARDRAEAREQEFVDKRRKGQEAKDRTKVINDELRQLAIKARDMKDFASDKKVQKLVNELSLLDIYKSNI